MKFLIIAIVLVAVIDLFLTAKWLLNFFKKNLSDKKQSIIEKSK